MGVLKKIHMCIFLSTWNGIFEMHTKAFYMNMLHDHGPLISMDKIKSVRMAVSICFFSKNAKLSTCLPQAEFGWTNAIV